MHSLCEQCQLSLLVTDLISSYLDESSVFTLSTVSRDLHEYASSAVYHEIELDFTEGARSGQKAIAKQGVRLFSGVTCYA